jgi:hypothetical protein
MESVDGQSEFIPGGEKSAKTPDNLTTRLKNWVNERPFKIFGSERKVRQNIANAVTTDILHPVGTSQIPSRLINYRSHINEAITSSIGKLIRSPIGENGVIKELSKKIDETTGKPFSIRVRRDKSDGGAWVSEEVGKDDEVISQAKIGDNEDYKITLSYLEPRYEEKGANPKLEDAPGFPTGTKVLFLNHLASLGIISWKGK